MVEIWDMMTGLLHTRFLKSGDSVQVVEFTPDNSLLAFVLRDGTVRIWNISASYMQTTLVIDEPDVLIYAVAFSPDGKLLASQSGRISEMDSKVKIWDIATCQVQITLLYQGRLADAIVFTPDGQFVALALFDRISSAWNLSTGDVVGSFYNHAKRMCLSSDRRYLYIEPEERESRSPTSTRNDVKPSLLHLDTTKEWIFWRNQKIVWLPPRYTFPNNHCPRLVGVNNNIFVQTYDSDQILLFQISHDYESKKTIDT